MKRARIQADPAPVRPSRFADIAGEALCAAFLIVVGGYLVGVATLL